MSRARLAITAFAMAITASLALPGDGAAETRATRGGLAAVKVGSGIEYGVNVTGLLITGVGEYEVTFKKSVRGCYYFVTPGAPLPGSSPLPQMTATAAPSKASLKTVVVTLWDTKRKAPGYHGFFLQVIC